MFMSPANLTRIPSETPPQPTRTTTAASSEADQEPGAPAASSDADQEAELAAYLRRIEVPDLDSGGPTSETAPRVRPEPGTDAEHADAAEAALIDQGTFYGVVFSTVFAVPGYVRPQFKPLAIQPEEQESARAASDAVYELLRVYFPAALRPGSDTLGHVMAAAPFLMMKAQIARAIIAEMRAERMRPANRDAAPRDQAGDQEAQQETAPTSSAADDMSWMDAEEAA